MSDLSVGMELNELIARVVMEWHKGKGGAIGGVRGYQSPWCWYDAMGGMHGYTTPDEFANQYPWSPSADIAAAWLVVEKIEQLGWWIELWYGNGLHGPKKHAGCTIGAYGDDETKFEAMADTVPHAICLAALQAKGYQP